MGYLKDRHGMMMLDNVPPDTCPECAVVHDPDAMAHCSPEVKAVWAEELKKRGVEIGRVTQ